MTKLLSTLVLGCHSALVLFFPIPLYPIKASLLEWFEIDGDIFIPSFLEGRLSLMTPKNAMDDKQLNFNQPLLSVRRSSSTAYPKVDRRKATKPPRTIPPIPSYKSDLKSGSLRNPGVIPFQWEQIPGRPKDESKLKLQSEDHEQLPLAPKLPPGRSMANEENPSDKPSQESAGPKSQLENDGTSVSDSSSVYKNAEEFERLEQAREENGSSISEGENSTYVDALDSLSRSESFLNCSVTGVSGLDGVSTKPTETFSDPLARELLIGRFLPAAKAVASETPHFGLKKQPVVKERPREVKKAMTLDDQNSRYYYAPISLPQHPQAKEEEEDTEDENEEDHDNGFGGNENVSVKLCGLLPRFCLLNPIPGMRDQVPRPISSVRKIHKKPANSGAFEKTDKAIRDAVYERRRLAVYKKSDMRVEANRLKLELNELYPQSDSTRLNEALKCLSSERADTAPFMKVSCNSLMPKEKKFLGIPESEKGSNTSKPTSRRKGQTRSGEPLSFVTAQEEPALAKSAIEKTLYIDSAQIIEYQDSNSSSSESRTESRGRNPSIDYSLHDMKELYFADNMIPSQERVKKEELQMDKRNGLRHVQDQKHNSSIRLPNAEVQQLPKKDDKETGMDKNPILPLPLPKSPSESWLSRALPSMSSRNPRAYVSTGNLGFRSSPVDPRWEANAKSSKLHNKHFGLPALTPIAEN